MCCPTILLSVDSEKMWGHVDEADIGTIKLAGKKKKHPHEILSNAGGLLETRTKRI